MLDLALYGSKASLGYDNPEGIIIFNHGSGTLFKKTFEYDKGKCTGEK